MTIARVLPLFLAVLSLFTVPQSRASAGRGLADADWNRTHPQTKAYQQAVYDKNWAKAALILRGWDTAEDTCGWHEEYAKVFDQAGDKEAALRHLETRFRLAMARNELGVPSAEIRELARFAHERKVLSRIAIVAALQRDLAGESDIAFALLQNLDPKEIQAALVPELQKEMAPRAFQAAAKRGDFPAATALIGFIMEKGLPLEPLFKEMTEACTQARDWGLSLQVMEYQIDKGTGSDAARMALAKEAQAWASAHQLTPAHWLVRYYADRPKGNVIAQLRELDVFLRAHTKTNATEKRLKLAYLRELLPDYILGRALNRAYDKVIACMPYVEWLEFPPDERLLHALITAHELGGKPDVAVFLCAKYAWHFSAEKIHVCDPQGNPELIKQGAEIAAGLGAKTGAPLMDAWVFHRMKVEGALENLQQLATANERKRRTFYAQETYVEPNFEEASACALASFLCGDIYQERNELRKALYWYHRATYLVSEAMSGSPRNSPEDSHFHEVLGVARQALVLAKLNQPARAARNSPGCLRRMPRSGPAYSRATRCSGRNGRRPKRKSGWSGRRPPRRVRNYRIRPAGEDFLETIQGGRVERKSAATWSR